MKIKVIPNKLWLARTPILPGLSTRCGQSLPVPEAPCLGKAWLLTGINKISFHPPTIFDLCISHRICDHKDAYIYIYIYVMETVQVYLISDSLAQLGTAWQECNISQEWCEKSAYAHSWYLWNISTPHYAGERDVWQKTDRGTEMEEWEEIRLLALDRGRWSRQLKHGRSVGVS